MLCSLVPALALLFEGGEDVTGRHVALPWCTPGAVRCGGAASAPLLGADGLGFDQERTHVVKSVQCTMKE